MQKQIVLGCGNETEFSNVRCVWGWVDKYNAYMCSVCGEEFLRPLTREEIEKEQKSKKK